MNPRNLEKAVGHAQHLCSKSGGRLTEKRKRVLEILLQSDAPLSAYELAHQYNKTADIAMHVMSFYRILEFLEDEGLVHKIQSTNKFIACSHIDGGCSHKLPQFLVCKGCNKVKEILMPQEIVDQLATQIKEVGFLMSDSQVELQCLCDQCLYNTE